MKSHLKKLANTEWGRRAVAFLIPFQARPSEFTRTTEHRLYESIGGLPITLPLAIAGLFAIAFRIQTTNAVEHFAWDLPPGEAIARSLSAVNGETWGALTITFISIHAIAGIRWAWHALQRKSTDRFRRDGKRAGLAPWRFFVAHTSGIAVWFALWVLVIAVVGKFDYGHAFTDIEYFVNQSNLWKLAFGALTLLFIVKLYQSNTDVFTEIYKDKNIVQRVRMRSQLMTGIAITAVSLLSLYFAFWLLHVLSGQVSSISVH